MININSSYDAKLLIPGIYIDKDIEYRIDKYLSSNGWNFVSIEYGDMVYSKPFSEEELREDWDIVYKINFTKAVIS